MDAQDVAEMMMEALYQDDAANEAVSETVAFRDAGVMTRDDGFVVRMQDGTAFQVTVVQSA